MLGLWKGYRLFSGALNHRFQHSVATASKNLSLVDSRRVPTGVLGTIEASSQKKDNLNSNSDHFSSVAKPSNIDNASYTGSLLAMPLSSKIDICKVPAGGQPPLFEFPGAAFYPGFNSDGSVLVTWDNTNTIFRWKLSTGQQLTPIKVIGNGWEINSVTANADASLVAVSYTDFSGGTFQGRGIQVYKNDDPKPYNLTDPDAFKYYINGTAFNPSSTLLVSGHRGFPFVCCWDMSILKKDSVNNPKQKIFLNGDTFLDHHINNLVFDPTGTKLAGGNMTMGGSVEWGGYTGFLLDLNNAIKAIPLSVPEYWSNPCIAFSADSQTLATGGVYRKPDNLTYAVTRLWAIQGNLLNGDKLRDVNSPFFGRRATQISFVGFDDSGSSQRVISVDVDSDNAQVRTCAVDGSTGSIIDQQPKILAFSYPNLQAKMKKQDKPGDTPKLDVKANSKFGLGGS